MIRTIALLFVLWLMALGYCSGARAATDEYEGCLAYNKPVTLTGTVLLRKIHYENNDDAPPQGSIPFALLVLDQPICMRPSDEIDIAENMEWALHIADACSRVWPTISRVKVTGTLYHAHNWHHHSRVLILAKQIQRLDGQLPACAKEPKR
jgi:hypothetical protein